MSFDPSRDPTADPGWSEALRQAAWTVIPGIGVQRQRQRMRAAGIDGLVVIRAIFLSFTLAIILIGGVVAILANFSNFSHRRTQPASSVAAGLAAGIVVVSLASLAVSARIGGRIRVTPTTMPIDLAGYYRTRFFLRVALSEACALLGFVGFIITVPVVDVPHRCGVHCPWLRPA